MLQHPLRSVLSSLTGLCLLVMVGCLSSPRQTVECSLPRTDRSAQQGPALVSVDYGTTATPVPLNAVLFTNESLARRTAVQAVFSSRTDAGTVQVSARLINCTTEAVVVRARTSFMRDNTVPAEPPTAWQNLALPPKATGLYTEVSLPWNDVAKFLIEVGAL